MQRDSAEWPAGALTAAGAEVGDRTPETGAQTEAWPCGGGGHGPCTAGQALQSPCKNPVQPTAGKL